MKKITLSLLFSLIGVASILAQAPQAFKYQAVVRDNAGNIIADQDVSLRVSILQDSINGPTSYSETHSSTTNQFGMIVLEIGGGIVETGLFQSIQWDSGSFFLKLELDETGNTNYHEMGTSQLLSVPYSLNSRSLTLTSPQGDDYEITVDNSGNLNTIPSNLCPPNITDIDGNTYNVIKIGFQCWMDENLTATKYNDGSDIPLVTDQSAWGNLTSPGYCWYNNDPVTGNTYGALYNWHTVNTGNLCPNGWRVPSIEDWELLISYVGDINIVGGKLKETGTEHWNYPNTGATNETGFTALPGGIRELTEFDRIRNYGHWWSATPSVTTNQAWYVMITTGGAYIQLNSYLMKYGFSVRCMKD